MTKQFTKEEAIEFADGEKWKSMTAIDRAIFQLEQDRLCMPFAVFHAAIEESLGEAVTTLGIAYLRDELLNTLKNKKAEQTMK
jgi:hypothetical protein